MKNIDLSNEEIIKRKKMINSAIKLLPEYKALLSYKIHKPNCTVTITTDGIEYIPSKPEEVLTEMLKDAIESMIKTTQKQHSPPESSQNPLA